jgi:hypothetical protein
MNKIPPISAVPILMLLSTTLLGEIIVKEDFEGDQYLPLRLWITDAGDLTKDTTSVTYNILERKGTRVGDIQTHYSGISEDKSASGKRSYKLDVTIPNGNMAYYDFPADIEFTEPLRLRGKLHVESDKPLWGTPLIGFRYKNPNFGIENVVWLGQKKQDLDEGWILWETYDADFDPRDWPEPLQVQGLTVSIRGLFQKTRVVLHLDDIELARVPLTEKPAANRSPKPIKGDYDIIPTKPITDKFVLPSAARIPAGLERDMLKITAARDEFEPGSFVILPGRELEDVKISVSPPTMGEHTLSRVDVRGVKCFWVYSISLRSSYGMNCHNPPELVPHFLLNDDELLRVNADTFQGQQIRATDLEGRTNYYDISSPNASFSPEYLVNDSPKLLPVDIPANQPKQFWVTVHVPPETSSGMYVGEIRVEPANTPAQTLPLSVNVLPFKLPPPALEYSVYYRGKLKGDETPIISSELKTERQLAAEFKNMREHGVTNPNVYEGYGEDGKRLARYLQIREEAGLSKERLFILDGTTASAERHADLLSIGKKFGYAEVYVYGPDEATGHHLTGNRNSFENTHKAGLKVFAAVKSDFYPLAGDLIDVPVLAGKLDSETAAKVKARGFRMYSYSNPQHGRPVPETYRRNYGLALWKAGYSGAMDYAYQHGMFGDGVWAGGHVWNPFDPAPKCTVAFPTSTGVVDTLAWEGYREGVDDVRYATLLQNLLNEAKERQDRISKADDVRAWLENLDLERDLDLIRGEIIQHILALKEALGPAD